MNNDNTPRDSRSDAGQDSAHTGGPDGEPGSVTAGPDPVHATPPRYSDPLTMQTILGCAGAVIVVVGLLVMVFLPMIGVAGGSLRGGMSSQGGRASATRAAMANLKTALVCFNSDLGRFPHTGVASDYDDAHVAAADALLDRSRDRNVLVNDRPLPVAGWQNLGLDAAKWKKRWKGPYMDADPSEFMDDAWNERIRYRSCRGYLWLWSAGPDGKFDDLASLSQNLATGADDIILSVAKLKGPGFATNTASCRIVDLSVGLDVDQPIATAAWAVPPR